MPPKKTRRLDISLSHTQAQYVFSEAIINIIFSGAGEGKTHSSIIAMIVHAARCKQPITCAIVRDTHENIKTSTVVSINKAFRDAPPGILHWSNDYKKLVIDYEYRIEVHLFGIDDPASLSKLQGPEYALIWLEEPAPIADSNRQNAGLSEDVYNAALLRCVREGVDNYHGRLQVSMNPADEDHWTYRRFIEEPDFDPAFPLITKKVYWIPPGENTHLTDLQRQAAAKAYKFDDAATSRYVKGKFAPVYRGPKVTPKYKEERHRLKENYLPLDTNVGFAMFDGWHSPSCLLGQILPSGRIVFIDTLRIRSASDVPTLLETQVGPMLESPKWKNKWRYWRIGGDATMKQPDQSNRQKSNAKEVEAFFAKRYTPKGLFPPKFEPGPYGPATWPSLKNAIGYALGRSDPQGEPLMVISQDNLILHKGLNGAWHYKTDNSGNPVSSTPEKDDISHPMEAWANACAILLSGYQSDILEISSGDYHKNIITTWDPYALGAGAR